MKRLACQNFWVAAGLLKSLACICLTWSAVGCVAKRSHPPNAQNVVISWGTNKGDILLCLDPRITSDDHHIMRQYLQQHIALATVGGLAGQC